MRRLKTYSAQSGYVYQYCYEGQRPYRRPVRSGTEFVFRVSADRKNWHPAKVLLADNAVAEWEAPTAANFRHRTHTIAKMALFPGFRRTRDAGAPEERRARSQRRHRSHRGDLGL